MVSVLRQALVVTGWIDRLQPLALFTMRLYAARVFISSGLVKIGNWPATSRRRGCPSSTQWR